MATRASHGMTRSKEHDAWQGMIRRCTNSADKRFGSYGGRGITVCGRWLDSFEAFHEDMGPAPSRSHSVDRIDNDGHYEPGNCRWATPTEQARNKTTSRVIEHDGRSMTMKEWSQVVGINYFTLRKRLDDQGMTLAEAISVPIRKAATFTHDGRTLKASEWATITGLPVHVIIGRINRMKWSVQDALNVPFGMSRSG